MDVPVPHLVAATATSTKETLQILVPLASLAFFAALLDPQPRGQFGRTGTALVLSVVLVAGPTATHTLGRT